MRITWTLLLICIVCVLTIVVSAVRVSFGEDVMDPEFRGKNSTDVVVGVVSEIYSKEVTTKRYGAGTKERRYLFEIQVADVEKGKLNKKDVVYVRAWKLLSHPGKDPILGRWGHDPLPKTWQRVRVFMVRGPYEPTGQTDKGYSALYESGFEIIEQKKQEEKEKK